MAAAAGARLEDGQAHFLERQQHHVPSLHTFGFSFCAELRAHLDSRRLQSRFFHRRDEGIITGCSQKKKSQFSDGEEVHLGSAL